MRLGSRGKILELYLNISIEPIVLINQFQMTTSKDYMYKYLALKNKIKQKIKQIIKRIFNSHP